MLCTYANLDGSALSAIAAFEKETGRTLLAYSCKDVSIEDMSDDDISALKGLEERLSVQLVAVKQS